MDMIGDTVKRLRTRRGMTQEELAKALSVKQQNIEQLENGKVEQPRYMKKLSDFFGVSLDQLYSGEIDSECAGEGRRQAHQQIDGLTNEQCLIVLKLIESVFPKQ